MDMCSKQRLTIDGRVMTPQEFVQWMRANHPAGLHKYWWHDGVWELLTPEEKGSLKDYDPKNPSNFSIARA